MWTGGIDLPSPLNNTRDTFVESLSFLQNFDPKCIGGIERVLQTAADLAQRHHQQLAVAQQSSSLTSRLNFWKKYSIEQSPKEDQASVNAITEMSETSRQNGLASQIVNTVWRGITNQTAMDDVPPSPNAEVDFPIDTRIQSTPAPSTSSSLAPPDIWAYAEKIKDSDAVATLSKVGTNWRAKTIFSSWGNTSTPPAAMHSSPSPSSTEKGRLSSPLTESPGLLSSSPKFREASPTAQPPQSIGDVAEKTRFFFMTRTSASSTPKSPPKPLLLNSHSRITSTHILRNSIDQQLRSAPTLESSEKDEWAEVMKLKHVHRDSQSSVSSLSPSDAFARATKSAKSDWELDTTSSRIVPLNRRSSPMAPHYRRPSSRVSSASSDLHSPPTKVKSPLQESSSIDVALKLGRGKLTSVSTKSGPSSDPETSDTTSYQSNVHSKRPPFSKDTIEVNKEGTRSEFPSRSMRVRTRRHPRLPNLDVLQPEPSAEEKSADSSKNLTIEFPLDSQENTITPKASTFGSNEHAPAPEAGRSPRRPTPRKAFADPECRPKASTDDVDEKRPRKLSSRSRKVSTGNREASRNRRECAAEEGDDEGYDELLSAYESEDATNESTRN